jgi:hypothetical protein
MVDITNDYQYGLMMQQMPQQPMLQSPYQSPINQFQGAITTLTDPKSALFELELFLRGQSINADGEIVQVTAPLVNNEGVATLLGQVNSGANQVTIMSNLEEEDIYRRVVLPFRDTINRDLMVNRVRYDIKPPANNTRSVITNTATNYVFITSRRGFEQGERKFWRGSQQEITTRIEGAGKMGGSKKGFLGLFNKN